MCLREAPVVNKVYRILLNNQKYNKKIKMIGIGASDDIYEIPYFIKAANAKYPLFPDGDRDIHKLLGSPPTPYFICVKNGEKGVPEIFCTHLGKIPAADKFIRMIIDESGVKI